MNRCPGCGQPMVRETEWQHEACNAPLARAIAGRFPDRRPFYLTDHARERMQGRGIPESAVRLVLSRGVPHPQPDGCEVWTLDWTVVRGKPAMARWRNLAVVVNPGLDSIVTVIDRSRPHPIYGAEPRPSLAERRYGKEAS